MFKLSNSIRFLFILLIVTSVSACSSTNLFQKELEPKKNDLKVESTKPVPAKKANNSEKKPNSLSPFILNAVERLSRVSGLSNSDRSKLITKLKVIKSEELLNVETKCKQAFDNLTPSKCDKLLLTML